MAAAAGIAPVHAIVVASGAEHAPPPLLSP
jgi:hypothetical protein